jgi:transposase
MARESRRNDEQVNTNKNRIDGEQKRQFSREFKSEAVRLSYQRDNIKDLANELGIQAARIYKWRAGEKNETKVSPTVKKQDHQEVKELRKALKNAELEFMNIKNAA